MGAILTTRLPEHTLFFPAFCSRSACSIIAARASQGCCPAGFSRPRMRAGSSSELSLTGLVSGNESVASQGRLLSRNFMKTVDWIVFAASLLLILTISVVMSLRMRAPDDYFTAGRRVRRWLLIMFAFGSGTSTVVRDGCDLAVRTCRALVAISVASHCTVLLDRGSPAAASAGHYNGRFFCDAFWTEHCRTVFSVRHDHFCGADGGSAFWGRSLARDSHAPVF